MNDLPSGLSICVDGRMLRNGTGVSTYARSLVDAVGRLGGHAMVLSASHQSDDRMALWLGAVGSDPHVVNVIPQRASSPAGLVGRDIFRRAHVHFSLRRRLLRLRADGVPAGVMHWTYPVPMVMDGWVNLYTIHDAIPLVRPDLSPIAANRHRAVLQAITSHACRIITVSEAARTEIVEAMGLDPESVINCGQPVDAARAAVRPIPGNLEAKGYFVFCGAIEPRKNIVALLSAYRASGARQPLVLIGPDGWRAGPILKAIAATPGAIRMPYLPREDLLGLIEGARAMLFPSLAEGFGLPVAEAMALGTATLTSNRGALAEIAAGACLLVDPEDSGDIAAGIARLSTDDSLVDGLSNLGRSRAAAFSQRVFAERLGEAYQLAFAGIGPKGYQHGSPR